VTRLLFTQLATVLLASISGASCGGTTVVSGGNDSGASDSTAVDDLSDAPNACLSTGFVDRSFDSADRSVLFDVAIDPPCMRIRQSQTVSFRGNFKKHRLVSDAVSGPLYMYPYTDTLATVEFLDVGYYRYSVSDNPRNQGLIHVVP
jgi:hypothetical protein